MREDQRRIAAVVPLERPVQAHGEEITHLRIREPSAADVFAVGLPMRMIATEEGDTQFIVSMPEMKAMLARLAAVPRSTLDMMTPGDVMALTQVILPFFSPKAAGGSAKPSDEDEDGEQAEAPSTEPSTSPGSTMPIPIPSLRSA